jgi:hypothetical protein
MKCQWTGSTDSCSRSVRLRFGRARQAGDEKWVPVAAA